MQVVRTVVLTALLAIGFAAGCGTQLEAEKRDGSNFKAEDWKKPERPVVVVADPNAGTINKPHQVRDPDGLLYRVDAVLHEHLAEIRLDDAEGKILIIFRGSDALKLQPEDLDSLRLLGTEDGKLVIRVREQEFRLRRHTS